MWNVAFLSPENSGPFQLRHDHRHQALPAYSCFCAGKPGNKTMKTDHSEVWFVLGHSRVSHPGDGWKSVRAGTKLTKHNYENGLLIQGHSQVSAVFSKGFYNSTQCRNSTYIIILCFERWNYQENCAGRRWETGYFSGVALQKDNPKWQNCKVQNKQKETVHVQFMVYQVILVGW